MAQVEKQEHNIKYNVEYGKFAIYEDEDYGDVRRLSGLQSVELNAVVATSPAWGDGVKLAELSDITSITFTAATVGETVENIAILCGQGNENGEFSLGVRNEPPQIGLSFIAKFVKVYMVK